MQKALLFILISLFLVSCDQRDPSSKLSEFLVASSDNTQEFKISQDSVTIIEGERGSKWTINPADLEDTDGNPVSSQLTVVLTELVDKEDLIKYNAQTVSDGKWLISGGAYHIEIFNASGKSVELKKDKTVIVQFPQKNRNPMQVFYGSRTDTNEMNWKLSELKLNEKSYESFLLRDTLVLDCEKAKEYRVDTNKNIALVESLGQLKVSGLLNADEKVSGEFSDTIYLINDTLIRYRYHNYFEEYAEDEELLTDTTVDKYLNKRVILDSVMYALKNPFDLDAYKEKGCAYQQDSLRFKANQNYRSEDVYYEQIKLAKLGWINIDRFYPETLDRATLKVTSEVNFARLLIIDDNKNTVVNVFAENGTYKVSIPKNKSFSVLGFQFDDDQLLVGKQLVKLNEDTEIKLDFKEIDESELGKLLNQ